MGFCDIPKGTFCAKSCGREAVSWYSDNISVMDMVHGNYGQPWCEHCVLSRQLEYSEEQSKRIPTLRNEIINLEFEESKE